MKTLTKKLNKFKVYSFLSFNLKEQKSLLDFLVNNLWDKVDGFKSKKKLKDFLFFNIFEKDNYKIESINSFMSDKIKSLIGASFEKYNKLFDFNDDLIVILLPTNQSFVFEKMKGSTGYTTSSKTIFIFINKKSIKNKKIYNTIQKTFIHEYNHSARIKYFPKINSMTLLDNIIFEGLADNFQVREIKGSKIPSWSKCISKKKAKIIFNEIIKKINSKNENDFFQLFFENKKYPLWSGYSIGYYIVNYFLKNNTNNTWKEIIKLKSSDILKKSNW